MDGDQLAELYKELFEGNIYIENMKIREKFKRSKGNRYLFYVTAHYVFPKKDLDETWEALEKKGAGDKSGFYWVNWMSALEAIEEVNARETWEAAPTMRLLLTDLRDLLYRKGLVPFHGFSRLKLDVKAYEFFFWQDEEFFSKIDVSHIKRDGRAFFWEED